MVSAEKPTCAGHDASGSATAVAVGIAECVRGGAVVVVHAVTSRPSIAAAPTPLIRGSCSPRCPRAAARCENVAPLRFVGSQLIRPPCAAPNGGRICPQGPPGRTSQELTSSRRREVDGLKHRAATRPRTGRLRGMYAVRDLVPPGLLSRGDESA